MPFGMGSAGWAYVYGYPYTGLPYPTQGWWGGWRGWRRGRGRGFGWRWYALYYYPWWQKLTKAI